MSVRRVIDLWNDDAQPSAKISDQGGARMYPCLSLEMLSRPDCQNNYERPTSCFSRRSPTPVTLRLHPHLIGAVDIRKQSVRIDLDAHDRGRRRDVGNVTPCAIEPDIHRDVDALHSSVGAC